MNKKEWKEKRRARRRARREMRVKTHLLDYKPSICPECGGEYVNKKSMLAHKRGHKKLLFIAA